MIKDHPYADGCKRIAASLFLEFLARNNALYRDDSKIISDGALVAITLMIAESRPEEKDIMVNLVMNFLTMQLVCEIQICYIVDQEEKQEFKEVKLWLALELIA